MKDKVHCSYAEYRCLIFVIYFVKSDNTIDIYVAISYDLLVNSLIYT